MSYDPHTLGLPVPYRRKSTFPWRMLRWFAGTVVTLAIISIIGIALVFFRYGRGLPDYKSLKNYEPPVATRLHAADGRLLAEFASEQRVYVPIDQIPPIVVSAFLAAEDKNFYLHPGVDPSSVLRAVAVNVTNRIAGKKRRPIGGSTITQQVTKNFLLNDDPTMERKIKEAILALRIEFVLSKERILELYLNQIFLGNRSYGVGAAALTYFNKSLSELNIAEAAYLAALPKGPNNYHPVKNHAAALARRNWVIGRMHEDGHITRVQRNEALRYPLQMAAADEDKVQAGYFSEDVRRWLHGKFGEQAIYTGGLSVRTTIDAGMQEIGERALRRGLMAYDRLKGWRGAEGQGLVTAQPVKNPYTSVGWQLATVLEAGATSARIVFANGTEGRMDSTSIRWTRYAEPRNVLNPNDIIYVSLRKENSNIYDLQQPPKIGGGLVAMDPHTGRLLAVVGGFSYDESQFNRASQALRQPGSTFKPFVYLAALENGYTPNSLVLDAPIVIDQGYGLGLWRPENYNEKFDGLSTLRHGIENSRNLMTVRLARSLRMQRISDVARRFGVYDNMPPMLSAALGTRETTLLKMTAAYAQLVNGGKKIVPTTIDRVQDRRGNTIYRHDGRVCEGCQNVTWQNQPVPSIPDNREQATDAASAYQMVSMLEGVVQRGTARMAMAGFDKPIAGKTGTTNDYKDAWFVGFSPDLAVGVYLGFDEPKNLGEKMTGGRLAAPIFRDFMEMALKDAEPVPFRIPPSIRLVRLNPASGAPASFDSPNVIVEAFKLTDTLQRREVQPLPPVYKVPPAEKGKAGENNGAPATDAGADSMQLPSVADETAPPPELLTDPDEPPIVLPPEDTDAGKGSIDGIY
jgi:penicillin-binding protein 1A